jgi:cyclopropane-fatty-acyl-phospholipid synthase
MSASSSIQNSPAAPPAVLSELFQVADIQVNGSRPWDIQVTNPAAYREILSGWSLGLGESYMAGYWECEQVDELVARLLAVDLNLQVRGTAKVRVGLEMVRAKLVNLQSRNRAFQVGQEHYDIGNDIFEQMLDSRMIYSCAYWEKAQDLEEAQTHKLEMICRKLELRPGERLLDIGCGWGGLAAHAARHHGVSVKGVTISKEQQQFAQRLCADLPVQITLTDYRDLNESFDKIVSVGMFEHVGQKNYADYFDTASRLLTQEGLFLLHTIGSDVTTRYTDPWIDKYIFPNGKTPSAVEISQALEGRFLIEDWHNFGHDYDKTLMAWHDNFVRSWPRLSEKYGPRFYRMWRYYLLACAGFFRARQGQLWQLVLSQRSRKAVYRSVRP